MTSQGRTFQRSRMGATWMIHPLAYTCELASARLLDMAAET